MLIANISLCRERTTWRCSHCLVHGSAVWAVRDGPNGPRVSQTSNKWMARVTADVIAVTM